jgi:hypothetical protein
LQVSQFGFTLVDSQVKRSLITPPAHQLYGVRGNSWQNSFIQNISASRNLARYIKALRGDEPGKFSVEVLYAAGIMLDILVRVTHTINGSGAAVTRLGLEREM